jgi:hypothetical protein
MERHSVTFEVVDGPYSFQTVELPISSSGAYGTR